MRRFWRLDAANKVLALHAAAMLTYACVVVRWSSGRSLGRCLRRLEVAEDGEGTVLHGGTETRRYAGVRLAAEGGTREDERPENKPQLDAAQAACFRGARPPARRPASQADQANAASASLCLRVIPCPPPPPLSPTAKSLVDIVEQVARVHPLRPLCLEQALAAKWLLARHGHASTLVIGAKGPVFEAHAWLELEPQVDAALTAAAGYQPVWRA